MRVLLDVRQRRGVRGREYAWANAARLQAALAEAGIDYRHLKELAPTTELRQLQYARGRAGGRRQALARRARARIRRALHAARSSTRSAWRRWSTRYPRGESAALLCVERDPEACHRSLIAARVADEHGVAVTHLRP